MGVYAPHPWIRSLFFVTVIIWTMFTALTFFSERNMHSSTLAGTLIVGLFGSGVVFAIVLLVHRLIWTILNRRP